MKPTIGRIVAFQTNGAIIPAIITHVYDQDTVNLVAFTDGHQLRWNRPSRLCTDIKFGLDENQWRWPEIVREESTK